MYMDLKNIKLIATPILKKHGVIRAAIFGSAASGKMTRTSDIDLLIELPKNIHGFDYVDLRLDLQADLEKGLGKSVDLVEYKLIKPSLKKYILPSQQQII